MKLLFLIVLVCVSETAGAGDFFIGDHQFGHSQKSDDQPAQLDPITVHGKPELFGLDLRRLDKSLPCMGCDGQRQGPPLALEVGKSLAQFLLKPFFQQPRWRGEPNDEALYYALRSSQCIDGSSLCLDMQPNLGLYNWAYDEKTSR